MATYFIIARAVQPISFAIFCALEASPKSCSHSGEGDYTGETTQWAQRGPLSLSATSSLQSAVPLHNMWPSSEATATYFGLNTLEGVDYMEIHLVFLKIFKGKCKGTKKKYVYLSLLQIFSIHLVTLSC